VDKSQLYDFLPVVLIFTWMGVITPLFPAEYRLPANYLGMGLCIGMMAMISEFLKWKAAEFTHIDANVRPSNLKLDLYVKEMETAEITPGVCATKLTLGEKVVHPFYGKLAAGSEIIIKHMMKWEDRMMYGSAKAWFKDQIIDHPKSAMVTLYETEISDMDHLEAIPVFWLKEAPLDYNLPDNLDPEAISIFEGKTVVEGGTKRSAAAYMFDVNKVKKENETLKTMNVEEKRQALSWHQKAIRLEEVNEQLKNELHAVLSSKSDMKQAVIEQVLTALEAYTKIRNALKSLQGGNWLTKGVILLILGVMIVGGFLINPEAVTTFISNRTNQAFIIILVALVAFALYIAKRRKQ
jgi:hypothetical protein